MDLRRGKKVKGLTNSGKRQINCTLTKCDAQNNGAKIRESLKKRWLQPVSFV